MAASDHEPTMKTVHLMYDDDDDDVDDQLTGLRRLSIEDSDGEYADVEMSDDDGFKKGRNHNYNDGDDDCFMMEGPASLPGTPGRAGPWAKGYASESEARGKKMGRARKKAWGSRVRERWLERAWEMKRSNSGSNNSSGDHHQCRVLVRPRGPDSGSICMDMDEVKACRELGLELPCDWTVEIPCGFSGFDTSSGGNSPIANWRISSPGDDPRDVKARLKMWAQAVALASASSLSG